MRSTFALLLSAACAVLSATAAPTLPLQSELPLLAPGSDWRFLDTGVDPGPSWIDPGFDDSAWAVGPAQLGYGDGDEATLVDYGGDPQNRHITTWFRTTFDVVDPNPWKALRLELLRDDGAVVYLNGVEIKRSRMTWTPIVSTTPADGSIEPPAESEFEVFEIPTAPLVQGTNVMAVEIHQASPDSDDLSFDLGLVALDHGVLVRGPWLQLGTPETVIVRWQTSEPEPTRLFYGALNGPRLGAVVESTLKTGHSARITGLAAGAGYAYEIVGRNHVYAAGPEAHFKTPAMPGTRAPFRAWIVGDPGTGNSTARTVRDAFLNRFGPQPSTWILLGDNAYPSGSDADYQRALFDVFGAVLRRSVVWSTLGNHDSDLQVYTGIFDHPQAGEAGGVPSGSELYYSFDWHNVHFVCLDSMVSSRAVGDPMYVWCEADLAATEQDWLVAFWHHPTYSKGNHDSDLELESIEMRQNFLPMLEANGVDLVLAGHSHGYERSMFLDGHYGLSPTFDPQTHVVDAGDGSVVGDGPYVKISGPHTGAVFSVAGCAGEVRQAAYDHPVMVVSGAMLGTAVLEVEGGSLRYEFFDETGTVRDEFTILDETHEGVFCLGVPHSGGCAVDLQLEGDRSVASSLPLMLHGNHSPGGQNGLLLYGYSPAGIPFLTGELCVAPPFLRMPPINGGGVGPCAGRLSFDLRPQIQSGLDPLLVPGATVYAQYWYRDPQGPLGAALSDAYQFRLLP